jgi:hypothetical protein
MGPETNLGSRELKSLSVEGIPAALERAQRYRLLNEPSQAESICLDILQTDPQNHEAIILLLLALTDQFSENNQHIVRARNLLASLHDEYQHDYYSGLICERQARAYLKRNSPGDGHLAHRYFEEAMAHYERAEAHRAPGNDEALLRWNCCVRTIEAHHLEPEPLDTFRPMLE